MYNGKLYFNYYIKYIWHSISFIVSYSHYKLKGSNLNEKY